ncbi:FlgO family outer membrane protein [Paraglaciecola aestuariivivens]
MKMTLLSVIICASFTGCNIFNEEHSQIIDAPSNQANNVKEPLSSSAAFHYEYKNKIASYQTQNDMQDPSFHTAPNNLLTSSKTHQLEQQAKVPAAKLNINHFAQGLMQDLMSNLQYVNNTTPLAVVSFVMLDSDFNQSNLLGNQMAESLMHEIHKFGIPVIDYKTTGFIRVTPNGDFAFSKDHEELGSSLAARYVLGGTLTQHAEGYLVNARIIGLKSKAVVASAQSFIPNNIADKLLTSVPTQQNTKLTSSDNRQTTLHAEHNISLMH